MGMEGEKINLNRREFLKVLGATAVTGMLPIEDAGAVEKKKPISPSLRGSPESQRRQNEKADKVNLSRIKDDAQLEKFKELKLLVPIPQNETVQIDPRLAEKWRWVRPWTTKFLKDIGREYYSQFKKPIQVNSAVRTVERQNELRGTNRNAASTEGDKKSSHLTGAAIDIAKIGMSPTELVWMRNRLLALEKRALIEATEERRQLVFHIMVFKNYSRVGSVSKTK